MDKRQSGRSAREMRERQRMRRKAQMRRVRQRCVTAAMMICLCLLVLWGVRFTENAENRESGENRTSGQADFEAVYEAIQTCLENNPELADFAAGYAGVEPTAAGGITQEEKALEHPLFLQWDKRWGYVSFGDDLIGLSGCGPTCMSMVIFSLTRDESATPDAMASYCTQRGHYVAGKGTEWAFMTDVPEQYGVAAEELALDESAMKAVLASGGMIICAMRPGDFTTTGHFIVLCGCTDEGFVVNDPYSEARSGQLWPYDTLRGQIKNLWAYHV